jgi:hypothetical protein
MGREDVDFFPAREIGLCAEAVPCLRSKSIIMIHLLNYEEALKGDPEVGKWIQLA